MAFYRKKPVIIEATCLTALNGRDVAIWCGGHFTGSSILIETLEGRMRADWGDYIIRGVQGEFYPCKPDIFEATYEMVEDESDE